MHCSLKLPDSRTISAGINAVGKYLLAIVDVIDKQVQGAAALLQAATHARPLARGDHAGNEIKGPGTVDVAGLAVHRERYAHFANRDFRRRAAGSELVLRQLAQEAHGRPRHLPRVAVFRHQLIECIRGAVALPAVSHAFHLPDGAVLDRRRTAQV
jgi:hypothetical protein